MKNVINLPEKETMAHLKKLAAINDLPTNNENLVLLALKIANECIDSLAEEDFNNLFNLKKWD